MRIWLGAFVVALVACGQTAADQASGPASLCELEGAGAAKLPLLLAEVGTFDAAGVTEHQVFVAESAGFGRVLAVPRLGGEPRELASYVFYVSHITPVDDAVWFVAAGFAGGGSGLWRIGSDLEAVLVDGALSAARDLEITPDHLYVADGIARAIYRYDRSGQARTTMVENTGARALLASRGETVYYLTQTEDGSASSLFVLDPVGGSTAIRGSLPLASTLFVADDVLYLAGDGIHAYDLETGVLTRRSDGPAGIQELVSLGNDFFVTTKPDHGDLYRVPAGGGTPELLADQLGWGGLASDGVGIFYDGGVGLVVRCPGAGP